MLELLNEALKSLAAYPPIAAIGGSLILFFGMRLMMTANRERKEQGGMPPLPSWLLYGPATETMTHVKFLQEHCQVYAETLRQQNDYLREMLEVMKEMRDEIRNSRQTLELIRNESRLR